MAGDFSMVSRDGIEQSTLQYLFKVPFWLLCVRACVRAYVSVCAVQVHKYWRINQALGKHCVLVIIYWVRLISFARQLIRCTDQMENPRVVMSLGKVARRLQNRMTKKTKTNLKKKKLIMLICLSLFRPKFELESSTGISTQPSRRGIGKWVELHLCLPNMWSAIFGYTSLQNSHNLTVQTFFKKTFKIN